MDYEIIEAYDAFNLADLVTAKIRDGYFPLGAPFSVAEKRFTDGKRATNVKFYQAVVASGLQKQMFPGGGDPTSAHS